MMAKAAPASRPSRPRWAVPGGSHDRIVGWSKIVLPMAVGLLIAVLALAPLDRGGDVSFILDKNKVDNAPERMRVEAARYSGTDDKGRAFSLSAKRAVQPRADVPQVDIEGIFAELALVQGPLRIAAEAGHYNLDSQILSVPGAIRVEGPDDYRLATSGVTVDMRRRRVESAGPVSGRIGLGPFSAGRLSADLGARSVVLDGGARLKIEQGVVR